MSSRYRLSIGIDHGKSKEDNAALKLPHMDEAQLGAVGERRDGQVDRQEK